MTDPQLAVNFAALLRSLRQKALLTQEELAARSTVSVGTIAGLENGRTRRPRAGSLRLLADALDLTDGERASLVAAAGSSGSGPARMPVGDPPTHLPPVLTAFVGRADVLARLDHALDSAAAGRTAVVTISGTAGVGKTTLALHWAHRLAARFPDGHLYLNLRGFDEVDAPMRTDEAVRHLLTALGPAEDQPPSGYAAQLAAYHRTVAERRLLIVLDNARDADQVAPLLPGSPGSLVVVTGRDQMSSLVAAAGAYPVELDVMSADEARELLAGRIGRARVDAEPGAVDDIIAQCARLPLALAVLAARAATYPDFPLAALAGQLREAGRLDVLSGDAGTDIRAVFTWSYRTLSAGAAELFRLLGVNGGAGFGVRAAASLLGRPLPAARPLLAELVRAHLVTEMTPGRYTCHDLLRAFAAEEAQATDPGAARAATFRLLDHHLQSAHRANRLIEVCQHPIDPGPARPDVTVEHLPTRADALAWLAQEHDALVAGVRWAAAHRHDQHTWQLAWSIKTYLQWRQATDDWIATQQLALAATEREGDPDARAKVHRALAMALMHGGRAEDGLSHIQRSLDLFIELGDEESQARAHHNLASMLDRLGRHEESLPHGRRTVEIYEKLGDRHGAAIALNMIGWGLTQAGQHAEALPYCERSLELLRDDPDTNSLVCTLDSIAVIRMRLGDPAGAVGFYQRAADLLAAGEDRELYAAVWLGLGDARHGVGDPEAAREAWSVALAVYEEMSNDAAADDVRDKLKAL